MPFPARSLVRNIQTLAYHENLWQKNDRLIVAVSGGPDSMCLLDILAYLAPKYGWHLELAHVNYRLRDKDSDLDEELVRAQAKHYRLPLTVYRSAASRLSLKSSNLEERLRDIRYQFFERLRQKKNCQAVAVAHHRDDQAETLLMRLIRGSGLAGLSAMRAKNHTIIRPLLATTKADILSYLKIRGLPFRQDKTNRDSKFLRNRIRHELLPYLEKNFEPEIKKILARSAGYIAVEYERLHTEISLALERQNQALTFSRRAALLLPEARLRHELRAIFKSELGRNPSYGLIDETLKFLRSTKSKPQRMAFRGLILERNGDTVRLLNFPDLPKKFSQ